MIGSGACTEGELVFKDSAVRPRLRIQMQDG